jgi:hypothetical protein
MLISRAQFAPKMILYNRMIPSSQDPIYFKILKIACGSAFLPVLKPIKYIDFHP